MAYSNHREGTLDKEGSSSSDSIGLARRDQCCGAGKAFDRVAIRPLEGSAAMMFFPSR